MPNTLFPVFDVPDVVADDTREIARYGIAPLFDFEREDFVLNGAGQIVFGTGHDAWVAWCMKIIATQRWAHLAYSDDIGVEMREVLALSDRRAQESMLERTITEALLADPARRTQQVVDFVFKWGVDVLDISCMVFGNDGNSAVVNAAIRI